MFDLSAHRGGRGLCPENTLPAFANALTIGVTSLEMDAAMTKDGIVVISHDPFLDPNITRGPDGRWIGKERKLIKSLTFNQLQRYDVGRIRPGTDYLAEFPKQKPIDGTRIPTLASVIKLVRSSVQDQVLLSIEAKYDPTDASLPTWDRDSLSKALVDTLRKEKFAHRAYIESFDWEILQIIQRLAPEIPTVYLTSGYGKDDTLGIGKRSPSKWTGSFNINNYGGSVVQAIKAAGGRIWSQDFRDLDTAQIKQAHDLGISVLVWTVNDPVEMTELIDQGVDGIVTDYPDRLRKVLIEKGRRPVTKPAGRASGGLMCEMRSFNGDQR
jgi:glycerophosphoryl diester phosphodiesterase